SRDGRGITTADVVRPRRQALPHVYVGRGSDRCRPSFPRSPDGQPVERPNLLRQRLTGSKTRRGRQPGGRSLVGVADGFPSPEWEAFGDARSSVMAPTAVTCRPASSSTGGAVASASRDPRPLHFGTTTPGLRFPPLDRPRGPPRVQAPARWARR